MDTLPVVLKRMLEITFSPAGILTLCLAVGLVLALQHRHRWGRRLLVTGAILYFVLVFSPLAEILIRNLEMDYPPLISPDPKAGLGTVVILSGYGEDHREFPVTSNLSEQTISCLVEGIRLYHMLPGTRIVLSGGVLRQGDRPVAAIMAEFVRAMGIADQQIVVEGRSQTTYENLYEVRKLIGSSEFVLVAAACDLRRAMAVARKLEMHPVPAPAYYWALQNYPAETRAYLRALATSFAYPSFERVSRVQWAFHEHLGYLWYRALGRV